MKHALLGMLGSHHQVSGPQQKVLTALLSDDSSWNWEDVFITTLLDISKHNKLRLGVKVSALILHACRGRKLSWSRTDPVYTPWIRLGTNKPQVAAAAAKKKRSKTQRQPSSSREEAEGSTRVQLCDSPKPADDTLWRVIPEEKEVDSPPATEAAADAATNPPADQEPAWRDIPDDGDELETTPPSTSGIPSSLSLSLNPDAELLSVSLPPLPSSEIPTAELTSASTNTDSPPAQLTLAGEQNPEVEYVGTLTVADKMKSFVDSLKATISDLVEGYISQHFPTLLAHPEPLSEVR